MKFPINDFFFTLTEEIYNGNFIFCAVIIVDPLEWIFLKQWKRN